MKQTVYTQTIIDQSTGEVIPTKWITKEVKNKEAFIRTYVEDIGVLARCSGAEQSTILCCLKYLDYNTNILFLDTIRKQEICDCGNIKMNTLHTAISRLNKKNILIKQSSSSYLLNPKLFFFGTDIEREKVFTIAIKYKINN